MGNGGGKAKKFEGRLTEIFSLSLTPRTSPTTKIAWGTDVPKVSFAVRLQPGAAHPRVVVVLSTALPRHVARTPAGGLKMHPRLLGQRPSPGTYIL